MSQFNKKTTAEEASRGVNLEGKNALITGANTGLGKETARVLALRGARVVMACRDTAKALAAREDIIASCRGIVSEDQIDVLSLDLNSLEKTRAAAEKFLSWNMAVDILVNNAGIMIPMERRTEEGFEAQFGINHLAHFLFTHLLIDALKEAVNSRVVVVSSAAQGWASMKPSLDDLNWETRKYKGMRAYGDSKLMNVMFARELHRRYAQDGIVANALHPGVIATELGRDQSAAFAVFGVVGRAFMKTVPQGAATQVMLATQPEYGTGGGDYFVNCQRRKRPDNKLALNDEVCQRLWSISAELTGVTG